MYVVFVASSIWSVVRDASSSDVKIALARVLISQKYEQFWQNTMVSEIQKMKQQPLETRIDFYKNFVIHMEGLELCGECSMLFNANVSGEERVALHQVLLQYQTTQDFGKLPKYNQDSVIYWAKTMLRPAD